jgi:hypothetical protein
VREASDLRGTPLGVLPVQQVASIRERDELGRVQRIDVVAEPGQLEVLDDVVLEQAHHVGRRGYAIPGPGFLGHGGAAHE